MTTTESLFAEGINGFCNKIGNKRTFYACRRMAVHGGKAVVQQTYRNDRCPCQQMKRGIYFSDSSVF
jgi:hypothetical protein